MYEAFPIKLERAEASAVMEVRMPTSEYPFEMMYMEPERLDPITDEIPGDEEVADANIPSPS